MQGGIDQFQGTKKKKKELLQEIGMGPTSMHDNVLSKIMGTLGSGNGSGSGVGVYMGVENIYLGDPWVNLPLYKLEKVL